jgi:hypothetical protein
MILKKVQKPLEGDLKIVTKFAWLPTWVDNKQIWFQRYQLLYEYKFHWTYDPSPMRRIYVLGWLLIEQKVLIKNRKPQHH